MNKQRNAIVIGGDHHNTLGVIRSLGERGVRSDLILVTQEKKSFVDASKYVDTIMVVPNDTDIVDCLLNNFANNEEKTVVISCSDASSGQLDEQYNRLSPFFYLPGGNAEGVIAPLMNKRIMAGLAEEVGLKIPQSYYFSEKKDICNLKTPCIFKPIESRKGKKADIEIVRTKEELRATLSKVDVEQFQIQEFIDKDFEYQLIGCSTQNEVIIPGVSTILRPCKGSNTSYLYYIPLEERFCDLEKCKDFVKRTGYFGLFSMEFLRDKNGNDFFMEINFRNDGNAICVTAAGISLPFIWYLDCLGKDYSNEINKEIKSVYVMPDMAELKLLLTGQISICQYYRDFVKTDRFMEFDSKDSKPFWALLKKQLHI